jgi:FMN-dependent NADH-azoreductase
MKKILHITASARGEESSSYRCRNRRLRNCANSYPDARVVRRDLCEEPLPHVDSLYSNTLARKEGGSAHAQGRSSLAWSDLLIEELKAADALVIATPMHNFTCRHR